MVNVTCELLARNAIYFAMVRREAAKRVSKLLGIDRFMLFFPPVRPGSGVWPVASVSLDIISQRMAACGCTVYCCGRPRTAGKGVGNSAGVCDGKHFGE